MSFGRQLKLRMQVNSFDAVSHMVASGLGIALLPKTTALAVVKNMNLGWRSLKDPWAQRQLMVAIRTSADQEVKEFRDYLCKTSQNAKSK
jgi:DNA-binding transcriptional LysR family regulator